MKPFSHKLGLLASVFLIGAGSLSDAFAARVYLQFKSGQKNAARGLVQQTGGDVHYEFDSLNALAITVPDAALDGIARNPNVTLVEEDPPRYLYSCSMPIEMAPWGLDAVQATDPAFSTVNGTGIKVGVIDSGVFTGHTDFASLVSSGRITGSPAGWNTDRFGHGTHVTGTIAAAINGSGVVGASPGVSIHMVKVFGDAGEWIYSSTLLNAAQNCQAAGCKIISMSLGGGKSSRTEQNGLQNLYNAGILLVAAAGNAGDTTTSYPAGYSSVMSVAAVDSAFHVASFSQQNGDVEISGPGVQVLSTVPYCEVNTATAGSVGVAGNHVEFSGRGTTTGTLVDGGLATATNPAWSGKIVLVERGTISFFEKVMNVQNSGGLACILYNNVANETLFATLGTGNSSAIPAIGLTQADGVALKAAAGQSATVSSSVTYDSSAWEEFDGTSMATPHVSAVAALVWSAVPGKSNVDIRNALTSTALDLGTAGRDNSFGYGLVQAKAALDFIAPTGGDKTPPVISGLTATVVNSKRATFSISWTTDEPSTTVVTFVGGRRPRTPAS